MNFEGKPSWLNCSIQLSSYKYVHWTTSWYRRVDLALTRRYYLKRHKLCFSYLKSSFLFNIKLINAWSLFLIITFIETIHEDFHWSDFIFGEGSSESTVVSKGFLSRFLSLSSSGGWVWSVMHKVTKSLLVKIKLALHFWDVLRMHLQ